MNDSKFLLNKGAYLKTALQRWSETFFALSSFSQVAILCGTAPVLVAVVFLLRAQKPIKSNKSKGERAREMKQAFQSIDKHNVSSNGSASMEVRVQSLSLTIFH